MIFRTGPHSHTRWSRGARGLSAAALVGALVLSGCATGKNPMAGPADLTVAVSSLPTIMDWEVGLQYTNENFTVTAQTQANLLRHPYVEDPENPDMAVMDFTSYEPVLLDQETPYEIDGNTYTFHLKEGVLSQQGNPLTTEDVIYSLERKFAYNSPGLPSLVPYFTSMDQVTAVDDHTFTVDFHHTDAGNIFLDFLGGMNGRIYDKEALDEHATEDDPYALEWTSTVQANEGWGFGPYTIGSITPDQQMVLEANENYALGEPDVKSVVFQVAPESGTRTVLLGSGSVDIAEALTPTDLSSLSGSDEVKLASVMSPIEFSNLVLTQNKEPFDNELVRQAFRYAVPYDRIIEEVYKGLAVESYGWLSTQVQGLDMDPAYTYDPEKAKELLAEAGMESVEFTLNVPNSIPDLVDSAILIQSEARKAGFEVNVRQASAGDIATGRAEQEFQGLLVSNRSQIQKPIYAYRTFFNPENPSNNNGAFTPPAEWEDLIGSANTAGDPFSAEAAEYWNQLQEITYQDASNLPMVYKQPNQAFRKGISNVSYRFDNTIDYSILELEDDDRE